MISASFGWNLRIQVLRRNGIAVEDSGKDHGGGRAFERHSASTHLVEHCTQGEEIAAAIEFFAACLFRGHVGGGADRHAGAGQIAIRIAEVAPIVCATA